MQLFIVPVLCGGMRRFYLHNALVIKKEVNRVGTLRKKCVNMIFFDLLIVLLYLSDIPITSDLQTDMKQLNYYLNWQFSDKFYS